VLYVILRAKPKGFWPPEAKVDGGFRKFLNPPSKYVNHEEHEEHEGKRESKKNSFCL
jgi:hypothetical protein